MPDVLIESAFISNPREERKLHNGDYRQRIAEALYEGIAAYKTRYEQRFGLRPTPAGFGP
jgi:N-acetylmuramoyl-L-alanine amidase